MQAHRTWRPRHCDIGRLVAANDHGWTSGAVESRGSLALPAAAPQLPNAGSAHMRSQNGAASEREGINPVVGSDIEMAIGGDQRAEAMQPVHPRAAAGEH